MKLNDIYDHTIEEFEKFLDENFCFTKMTDPYAFFHFNSVPVLDYDPFGDICVKCISERHVKEEDFHAVYVLTKEKNAKYKFVKVYHQRNVSGTWHSEYKQFWNHSWKNCYFVIGSKDGKSICSRVLVGTISGINSIND